MQVRVVEMHLRCKVAVGNYRLSTAHTHPHQNSLSSCIKGWKHRFLPSKPSGCELRLCLPSSFTSAVRFRRRRAARWPRLSKGKHKGRLLFAAFFFRPLSGNRVREGGRKRFIVWGSPSKLPRVYSLWSDKMIPAAFLLPLPPFFLSATVQPRLRPGAVSLLMNRDSVLF